MNILRTAVAGSVNGCPVNGYYDTDGAPLHVEAMVEGFRLAADTDNQQLSITYKDDELILPFAAIGQLAALIQSDALPALVEVAAAHLASAPLPALACEAGPKLDTAPVASEPVQPTAREVVTTKLESFDTMPNSQDVYALLLEDRAANYLWWRCVDWVLYRQRQGLPVERLNDQDTLSAEINACFNRAVVRTARLPTKEVCIGDISNATMLTRWHTPADERPGMNWRVQEAKLLAEIESMERK